jgi:hypothetical protein
MIEHDQPAYFVAVAAFAFALGFVAGHWWL